MIIIFSLFSNKNLFLIAFLAVIASANTIPQSVIYSPPERTIIGGYLNKSLHFAEKYELDSAIYYNKLLLIIYSAGKDTIRSAKGLTFLARLFQRKLEYDSAIACVNAGLELLPINSSNFQLLRGDLYSTLGSLYLTLEDYANAEIYYKLALNIRLEIKANEKIIIDNYFNLGNIQFGLGHFDNTIYYCQKALERKFNSKKGIISTLLANTYGLIGNALIKKNNITEAKKYFLKGFSYAQTAALYLNLGKVFILEKNFVAADTALKKALELRLSQFGAKHYLTSKSYDALADLYRAQKNYTRALEYYTNGLNSSIKSNEEDFFSSQNHKFKDITSVAEFFNSLKGMAAMLLELAKKDSAETRLLYAKKLTGYSIPILSEIQKYYIIDDSKLKLRELADEIMNLGVEACYEIYKLTGDQKYVSQAFFFSETKRNSVLSESKTKRDAMRELKIPDSLKNAELKLKLKLNKIFTAAEDNITNDDINSASVREYLITSTVNAYDSLLIKIKHYYPKYASLVSFEDKLNLHVIRKNSNDDVILEYTITKNKIFLFCISKGSIKIFEKVKKQSFDKLINDYLNSLRKINKKTYLSTSGVLYNELILPVEKKIINTKKLIIIPCPEIASIPFEALISPKGSRLLETVCIQYLGSSNYFRENNKVLTNNYPYYFIGIAPSYGNQKDYTALNNKEEIIDISGLLKNYNLPDTFFVGENATESNLFNSINNSKILHIAAHSFADTLNGEKSGIVLCDKILTAAEIVSHEFNNDLVVLSSCEGGNGKTAGGEGVLSLARKFISAGAKNLLVALWKVPDKQTRIFMIEFYKQLVKGNNYAEALTGTKRVLIKDKLFAFPNTWAAFVLIK